MRMVPLVSLIVVLSISGAQAQDALWEPTGGPYKGSVNCFLVEAGGMAFAGGDDGDVYRSTDEGETWALYASCGDGVSQLMRHPEGFLFVASYGSGVFRSLGDSSWVPVNNGLPNPEISSLAVLPDGSLLAGCPWEPGWVFRSTNGGNSWTEADSGLEGHGVRYLVVDDRGTIFAGTNFSGMYVSTDGSTWMPANNGLAVGTNPTSLVVAPDSTVYVTFGDRMYFTSDQGNVWTEIQDTLFDDWIASMAVGPDGVMYVGTGSMLLRSTDGGSFWAPLGGMHAVVNAIALVGNGALLVGSVGIQKADSPESPFSQRGFVPAYIKYLVRSPDSSLYAASSGQVYRAAPGGHWEVLPNLGYSRGATSIACSPSGHVFVGYEEAAYIDGGVLLLSGRRDSWLSAGRFECAVTALHCDSDGILYAGTPIEGIYRSTNEGGVWTGPHLVGPYPTYITSASPGNIYAAAYSGVFFSIDSGLTWTNISAGLPTPDVKSLAVAPPLLLAGEFGEGVVYRREADTSWQRPGGFPGYCIVYGLTIVGDRAYAGTIGQGVYRCYTDVQWWEQYGLADESVNAFAVGSDGYLYAATGATGVVRTREIVTGVAPDSAPVPAGAALCQNYPNPFNPSTTIRLRVDVHHPGVVEVRVYTILGQLVRTLPLMVGGSGEYDVLFDGTGDDGKLLPSGVYLYTVHVDNTTLSGKMTLLK